MTKTSAAVLGLLATTGCTYRLALLPVRLPAPEPPALPSIQEAEVQCLSNATWRKLVTRDALRQGEAQELRAILRAINGNPDPARP